VSVSESQRAWVQPGSDAPCRSFSFGQSAGSSGNRPGSLPSGRRESQGQDLLLDGETSQKLCPLWFGNLASLGTLFTGERARNRAGNSVSGSIYARKDLNGKLFVRHSVPVQAGWAPDIDPTNPIRPESSLMVEASPSFGLEIDHQGGIEIGGYGPGIGVEYTTPPIIESTRYFIKKIEEYAGYTWEWMLENLNPGNYTPEAAIAKERHRKYLDDLPINSVR
jgi:hypothetical protein